MESAAEQHRHLWTPKLSRQPWQAKINLGGGPPDAVLWMAPAEPHALSLGTAQAAPSPACSPDLNRQQTCFESHPPGGNDTVSPQPTRQATLWSTLGGRATHAIVKDDTNNNSLSLALEPNCQPRQPKFTLAGALLVPSSGWHK